LIFFIDVAVSKIPDCQTDGEIARKCREAGVIRSEA
jgi:hypothetical protein